MRLRPLRFLWLAVVVCHGASCAMVSVEGAVRHVVCRPALVPHAFKRENSIASRPKNPVPARARRGPYKRSAFLVLWCINKKKRRNRPPSTGPERPAIPIPASDADRPPAPPERSPPPQLARSLSLIPFVAVCPSAGRVSCEETGHIFWFLLPF